jgi:hypothetical protein
VSTGISEAIDLIDKKRAEFKLRRDREAAVMRAYSEIKSMIRDMPDTPITDIKLVADDAAWRVGDYPVLVKGVRLLDWGKDTEQAHDVAMRFALTLVRENIIGGAS